jgi:hypothetical protein
MTASAAVLLVFAMITGIECALLYLGFHALFDGKLPAYTTATCVVQGWPARLIGCIALLPIPITLAIGTAVTALFLSHGRDPTDRSFYWMMTAVEGAVVLVCIAAITLIGRVAARLTESPRARTDRRPRPSRTELGPGAPELEKTRRSAVLTQQNQQ